MAGAAKAFPPKLDPNKAWVLGEPPQAEDVAMARIVDSPVASVGTALESRQRVVQVCLGAEHGILLTDAGIACTWGDNRFGQLGRRLVQKEEKGQPYPVLALQNEEIGQVASGKNHCLALTADGRVWAWGRNKAGQLGCGDNRDKVLPELVSLQSGANGQSDPLGTGPRAQIITIGAGGNSSVAAALNSDVWQWGEISRDFTKVDKEMGKQNGRSNRGARDNGAQRVKQNRPFRVLQDGMYRSSLRERRVAVSAHGCRVLGRSDDKPRLHDLVESMRQLQDTIGRELADIAEMDNKTKQDQERRRENIDEEGAVSFDQRGPEDTIAVLEVQIKTCERNIGVLKTHLQSCELQQAHNREQIASLMQQGTRLSNEQDDFSEKVLNTRGADRKGKEMILADIRKFVAANQNTRMTLLNQRAEMDKEKQQTNQKLYKAVDDLASLKRRLDTVRGLARLTSAKGGSSDTAMIFLREQRTAVVDHFAGKMMAVEFVEAKTESEADMKFLDGIERKMAAMVACEPDQTHASRIRLMLQDIVDLRRTLSVMYEEELLDEDLDLSSFFERDDTPVATSRANQVALPYSATR